MRYLFFVIMLVAIGVLAFGWIISQTEERDTSFQCRPGETYTTAECR